MARNEKGTGLGMLAALGWALLLRRRPLRKLHDQPQLNARLPVLSVVLFLCMFAIRLIWHDGGYGVIDILLLLALSATEAVFWLLTALVAAEPFFHLLLRSATFDEAELHWLHRRREASRMALLLSTSVAAVVLMLFSLALRWFIWGGMAAASVSAVWAYIQLTLTVRDWRHQPVTQAMVIASGPLLIMLTAAFLRSYPWPVTAAAAGVMAALSPIALKDLFNRRKARAAVEEEASTPTDAEDRWLEIIEELHMADDSSFARQALAELERREEPPPDWVRVRLLCAAGRLLEAVDAGIESMEVGGESSALHLALAEACLGLHDNDNAAAHAEEALERAGGGAGAEDGAEALLLLALASFSETESETAARASGRVAAYHYHDPSPRLRRIIREARMLLRRFGTLDE